MALSLQYMPRRPGDAEKIKTHRKNSSCLGASVAKKVKVKYVYLTRETAHFITG